MKIHSKIWYTENKNVDVEVNVLFAALNSVVKEEISKEMTELNEKKQPVYTVPLKYISFQNTLGKIPHHLNNIDV